MLRRSANAIWSNQPRLQELGRRCSLISADVYHQLISSASSGCDTPSDSFRVSGHEDFMDRDILLSSSGLENGPRSCKRGPLPDVGNQHLQGRISKQLDSIGSRVPAKFYVNDGSLLHPHPTGYSDQKGWTGSCSSSPIVAGQGGGCSPSMLWKSSKLGRRSVQSSGLCKPWRSDTVQALSTKADVTDGSQSSKANEAELPSKTDVFRTEEIEGPTVDRDLSDTANELRESLGELTTFMAKLSKGFVVLGSIQLAAAVWSSYIGNGLLVSLSHGLAFVLSSILAYLLRHHGSAVSFFAKVEERSRLRVLTLALQVIKALAALFYRSDFVVKVVSFGSLVVLIGNVYHSL